MSRISYINQYEADEINVGYDSNDKTVYIELNDDFNSAWMYIKPNQVEELIDCLKMAMFDIDQSCN